MRPATLEDIPYIAGQILDGARQGQFEKRLLIPEQADLLYRELDTIIRHGCRTSGPLSAVALIFLNGPVCVGHAIMTEVKNTEGIELYSLSVDAAMRGAGYGSTMLDMLIARFLPQAGVIIARCYPRTVVMYELLVSRGFEYMMTLRSGLRVLCLNPKLSNSSPN